MLKAAFWALRWWVTEFCSIPAPRTLVATLTGLCRLTGCAVLLALIRCGLGSDAAMDPSMAAARDFLVVLLATLLGNLAKELAFVICADIANWCGQPFVRRGFTLTGHEVRETRFADGTWVRCESGQGVSACEWTEASGACKRISVGPSGQLAAWASRTTSQRGQIISR